METADGTLGTAQDTFTRVNELVAEDVTAIVGDVRSSVANLEASLDKVSADLPQITADVRATLERTSRFIEHLDSLVLGNSDQIEAFMRAGLPQFIRFVEEASRLVVNLQRLTSRIESDPARFLLGTQAPEYRR
jgi:phospholipid/cholesterol/gamma-HCH transport system substrate-binding protein